MNRSQAILILSACVVAIALSIAFRTMYQLQVQTLDELSRIRRQLESIPAVNRSRLSPLQGDFLGDDHAPLTMVEFIDLECPFSRQYHTAVFDRIRQEYVDTGKLRYFTRQYPLESIHPFAIDAARAALCAGEQRQLWPMRHTILVNNTALDRTSFDGFARELQLNADEFRACVNTPGRVDQRWQADHADGRRIGIAGTPVFLIGPTSDGAFDGMRLSGALPFEEFKAALDGLLAGADSR